MKSNEPAFAYKQGMIYESFMLRAFNTYDNSKPGMHCSVMQNLIDSENGESWVEHLDPFSKQLNDVKQYLDKGFDRLLSRNFSNDKKHSLLQLRLLINKSKTTEQLMDIINKSLDIIL